MQQLTQQRKSVARSDKRAKDGADEGSVDTDDADDTDDSDRGGDLSSSGSSAMGDSSSESGSESDSEEHGGDEEEEDGMATFLSEQPPRPNRRRAAHAAMSLAVAAAGVRHRTSGLPTSGGEGEGEGDGEGEGEDVGEDGEGHAGSERVVHGMAADVAAAATKGNSSAEVHALASSSTTFVLKDCARVMQHVVRRGGHHPGQPPSRQALEAYAAKMAVQTIETTQAIMGEVSNCCPTTHTHTRVQIVQVSGY